MIRVAYYRRGDHELSNEHFDKLADAIDLVRELKRPGSNRGWAPQLHAPTWSATLGEDKQGRARWGLRFQADGIFRSRQCGIAEGAGVRYASHRRGYQASERAFGRFVAGLERLEAV